MAGKEPVGVVGLGLMGSAFAQRLLNAGFRVIGHDVDPDRIAAFASKGGEAAGSLVQMGQACEQIVIAVVTMAQVNEVVEGPEGLLSGLADDAPPRTLLCTATVEFAGIETLAARMAERGHALLDAPASGTSKQVAEGKALGLVAGEAGIIARAKKVLDVLYPRRCTVGPAGAGTKTKLAINLILGLNRIALAEGLVFAERIGLDCATFFKVAQESAAYSQVMEQKGAKMLAADWSPVSKISPHLKDVRTMLREAGAHGQQLPLATVLADVLEACEKRGEGELDNAVMIEEIRRRRA